MVYWSSTSGIHRQYEILTTSFIFKEIFTWISLYRYIWSNCPKNFFFVIGSMKYQTLLTSLAKLKQSDRKQIITCQFIHSGPDLCWQNLHFRFVFNYLKRGKPRERKISREETLTISRTKKYIFAEFIDNLISWTVQKERFYEKKTSRISKCIEKNKHVMYCKKKFLLIKDDVWLVENAILMFFNRKKQAFLSHSSLFQKVWKDTKNINFART